MLRVAYEVTRGLIQHVMKLGPFFDVYGFDSKTKDLYKGSNANAKWAPTNGAIESCLPIGMGICYPLCIP